ncbi:hypothetical protein GGI13_006689, partial [Coemansia sp. RSA 455]
GGFYVCRSLGHNPIPCLTVPFQITTGGAVGLCVDAPLLGSARPQGAIWILDILISSVRIVARVSLSVLPADYPEVRLGVWAVAPKTLNAPLQRQDVAFWFEFCSGGSWKRDLFLGPAVPGAQGTFEDIALLAGEGRAAVSAFCMPPELYSLATMDGVSGGGADGVSGSGADGVSGGGAEVSSGGEVEGAPGVKACRRRLISTSLSSLSSWWHFLANPNTTDAILLKRHMLSLKQ